MKTHTLLLFVVLLSSCKGGIVQNNTLDVDESFSVEVPKLLDAEIPNASYSSDSMVYASNKFVTIGDITQQSFSINTPVEYEYNYLNDDYKPQHDNQMMLYIDTTQHLTIEEYQLPDDFYETLSFEDYIGSNFQQMLDQYPLFLYDSYAVFLINQSSTFNTIVIEDGSFAMIYEAKNKQGKWQPIEFKTYSWCGNSYADYDLQKGQFALFKVPVQSGDFKTKLRLKARIKDRTFYSNEISGYINASQFEMNEAAFAGSWGFHWEPESYASLFLDE